MANKNAGMVPSKLTLGTVQLGMPYGIHNRSGVPSEESSLELLREAWDRGVVSFDTAAAYGESELVLGRFAEGKRPLIITKIAMQPESGVTRDEIERDMREKVERSLKRLRLSSVPILMLHNTDCMEHFGEPITAAFRTMAQEGLIGKAGISISHNTSEEYKSVWWYLRDDIFEALQIPMNVLDHRPIHNGLFDMLSGTGKLLFVRSVFLQGLIFMRPEELPSSLKEALVPLAALRELSVTYSIPAAQLAVSFIRDMPGVHSLIIGADNREQLRENLALIDGPPIPDRLREQIMDTFSNVPEKVVTPHRWN